MQALENNLFFDTINAISIKVMIYILFKAACII
jgi:hypothetical protein